MTASLLLDNIGELVTNDPDVPGALGLRRDVALVIAGEEVAWIGPGAQAPAVDARIDCGAGTVLPGFVDSHSHLVFAGDRADEFAARMAGQRYAAGGIKTTVEATRAADDQTLRSNVHRLAEQLRRSGITTFEIKSGYGLTGEGGRHRQRFHR
jgi:imidazolonepropionase